MPAAAPRPAPNVSRRRPDAPERSEEPTAIDPLLALADQCVQCGLCLPACPTYALERTEAESPRGRIALARAWALQSIDPTAAGDTHLDHCLACGSCEAVCPANVQYGALLVQARSRQRSRRTPGWRQRWLEWLVARPKALGALLGVYRRLHPLLPAGLRPLPRPPAPTPMPGQSGARPTETVALFRGCVARGYEGGLLAAVTRLLDALDVGVGVAQGQTCCGTLHAHAGNDSTAAALAARNREAFAPATSVLTLASGCHEAVASALQGVTETHDAIDYIATRSQRLRWRHTPLRVALHLPCTQRNVVGSAGATRALLAAVPGLELVELPLATGCCGAAGTAMLEDPRRAASHRQPLLDAFAASGASRLLSANIGCRLHLGNADIAVPVQHPLEFLAECLP